MVESAEGSGPFGVKFSVKWKNGGSGYEVICECGSENVKESRTFKTGPIRFTDLRAYENPANDYWESHGQGHKVFPHSIFVGQAVEGGRPVTYFWEAPEEPQEFVPHAILKTFRANTRYLGGLEHGESGPSGFFVERAKLNWLPVNDRPTHAQLDGYVKRRWTYQDGKFVPSPWKLD